MQSDRFQSAKELFQALLAASIELGVRDAQQTIAQALVDAGLSSQKSAPRPSEPEHLLPPKSNSVTFARASAGLFVAFVLLASGAVAIQLVSRRGEQRAGAQGGRARLELLPRSVAYLRVVAHPWAHVIVDGQHVDTTPFARPIPLSAGTHYVRFEHPSAPAERRTVKLRPGETLLLDVSLKLAPPASDAGVGTRLLGAETGTTDDGSP
jgi:serine/threonine-protein kinase